MLGVSETLAVQRIREEQGVSETLGMQIRREEQGVSDTFTVILYILLKIYTGCPKKV